MEGKYYIHYRTKNIYKVIEELFLENPSTRNWEEGVLYQEAYSVPDVGKIKEKPNPKCKFVRSKERFLSSFVEVNLDDYEEIV